MRCGLSAIRPDDPQSRGVALPMNFPIPVIGSEVCAGGDSGGGVEQKESAL